MDTGAREEVKGKEDRAYAAACSAASMQLLPATAFCSEENYPQILWISLWILAAENFSCF
jgi:hypothetical protein